MRIAVIAADLIPGNLGGAEIHLIEVLKRLAKKSYNFELFVGPDTEISKTLPSNTNVHPVKYLKTPNLYGLSYLIFAVLHVERVLRELDVDIIWAKQVFPQAVVGAILSKRLKKPLYVTAQNPLAYKEELTIKGPIPFKDKIPNLLTPLIKFALKNADIVAAVSTYSKLQAMKLGAKQTTVIPNGVDFDRFKIPKKTKKGKTDTIITTSSLIPRNGIDTLIEAVSYLPKSLNWKLIIAGDGPEEANLKSQIANLKLERKVNLIGRVENRKIPRLLNSADVFVRLSRKEGFGVSFLEAMATGIPVVATPVGGIIDFVKHQQTGLLVEPDKPSEAAKAIERILRDEKLYLLLQQNGKKLVKKQYSWDNIADEVDKVFKTIS